MNELIQKGSIDTVNIAVFALLLFVPAGWFMLFLVAVAGLEFRWRGPFFSTPVVLAGDLFVFLGYAFIFRVFQNNTFAASTVRVEAGQRRATPSTGNRCVFAWCPMFGKSILCCFLLAFAAFGRACEFETSSRVLFEEGAAALPDSKLIQVWDVNDSRVFRSRAMPASLSLDTYLAQVRAGFKSVKQSELLKASLSTQAGADAKNNQTAYRHRRRLIRPVRCLEALLLSFQTDRLDMVSTPTEFTAFVLKSKRGRKLRIYYYTVNQAGIGGMRPLLSLVETELKSGQWRPWLSLHNHNFFLNGPRMGGTVAPSAPDVGFFQSTADELGLEEAWITNGFDTLTLRRRDFRRFSGR